jgi:hypothetical protein
MADDVSRMLIEVKVENGEASIRQLKGVGKAAKGAGDESGSAAKKIKEHSEGYNKLSKAATLATVGGIALVTGGIYEAAKAGVQWQSRLTSLTTALKNSHQWSKNAANEIGSLAEKSSEHGGFGAEEEVGGITKFISETKSRSKAIRDNATVVNFARAQNIPYAKSLQMVQMAQTGKIGRLEKEIGYIPKVTEHTKKVTEAESERKKALEANNQVMNNAEKHSFELQRQEASRLDKQATAEGALHKIEEKGRGGAARYAHSLKGMWEDLKHQLDNVARTVGTAILPTLTKVFKLVIGVFGWLGKHKEVLVILGSVAAAVWAMSAAFAAYNAYLRVAAVLEEITAVDGMLMWGAIALGVVVAVVAIVEIIKHFKQIKEVAIEVWHAVVGAINSAIHWIEHNWPLVAKIIIGTMFPIVGVFLLFKKQIIGIFDGVVNWIETAFTNVLKFLESIPGKIVKAFMKLPSMLGSILNKIPGVSLVSHALGSIGLNSGGLVPGFASGGVVPGYGFSDSIPAMLTPGEFVVRKQAVQSIGVGTLNAMNGTNQTNPVGGSSGGQEYVPIVIVNKVDSRVLSESTTRYALKKKRQL